LKKDKAIDAAMVSTESDIQEFQNLKQRRLNEIDVVVTLKLHQLQCLINDKLPLDTSDCIVFTNSGLEQLTANIERLKSEKKELEREQKRLKKEHVTLTKSKKQKEKNLAVLEARAKEVQLLKFGQEIDLDALERLTTNKQAEELRAQLKSQELAHIKEQKDWQRRVEEAGQELANITALNTEKLERVSELTAKQHKLEKALNSTQTKMVAEVGPSKEQLRGEREKLVSLVKLQAKEMEALKAEINMLRRKGGHVYTPVVRRQPSAGR